MGVPRMSLQEFTDEGYLQEANRRFFHPLGLALAIATDGTDPQLVALDGRDNPFGWWTENVDLRPGAAHVDALMDARMGPRRDRLGYLIQPEE